MICPKCGSADNGVTNSRDRTDGGNNYRWRRRQCNACPETFTTYEVDAAVIENLGKLSGSLLATALLCAEGAEAIDGVRNK